MSLSFKQVVAILKELNGIDPDRQTAFESRLKQWQKMGFPDGVNVGKGTRASYGAKQLYQLAICLALLEIGLTPERAHEVIRLAWSDFQKGIVEATECIANLEKHNHYWFIKYDAIFDLKLPQIRKSPVKIWMAQSNHIGFAFEDIDHLEFPEDEYQAIQETKGFFLDDMARCILLEVDTLLARIWIAMAENGISAAIFKDEIGQWRQDAHVSPIIGEPDADLRRQSEAKMDALKALGTLADKHPPEDAAKAMLDAEFGGNLHDRNSQA